jgi:PPP family 3-phenylpropionic acid transporter
MTQARARGPIRPSAWLSGSYFWYFAGIGCFGPYISLFYLRLQLSGVQIGMLAAILPLGVALLAPLWGALADSLSAHRAVLRGALVLAALVVLALSRASSFGLLALLMLLLATALAAIPALLDSYAVTICEREGLTYGQLRVWGSVGFIGAVWVVAWRMGAEVSSFFLVAYAATLLLTCATTFGLPPLRARSKQPAWQGVASILGDRSVLALLLTVYLIFSSSSVMGGYFSIYLSELGGDVQLVGVASAIAAFSELPVMLFGGRLLARFTSRNILVFAVLMYIVRLGLFSLPPDRSWVVFVQLFHGLSFGLYLMASVTLMHELAGRERAATAQGLLTATNQGFAAVTGSLVGGALLDQIGAVGLFRTALAGMAVAFVACLISVRVARPAVEPALRES